MKNDYWITSTTVGDININYIITKQNDTTK